MQKKENKESTWFIKSSNIKSYLKLELSHFMLLISFSITIYLFNAPSNACTFSETLPNEVREIHFWQRATPARDKLTCQSSSRIQEETEILGVTTSVFRSRELNFPRSSQKSAGLVAPLWIGKFRLPRERSYATVPKCSFTAIEMYETSIEISEKEHAQSTVITDIRDIHDNKRELSI